MIAPLVRGDDGLDVILEHGRQIARHAVHKRLLVRVVLFRVFKDQAHVLGVVVGRAVVADLAPRSFVIKT